MLPAIFILLLGSGCAGPRDVTTAGNAPAPGALNKPVTMTDQDLFFSLLRSEFLYWKGTPYQLGGTSRQGIDCSALVQLIYKNSFKIAIARTTKKQVQSGAFIKRSALKVADLVFFKTSWKARHVGIYLGDNQFLHASVSKGVMISSLDNVYWQSKYWQSRRIIN